MHRIKQGFHCFPYALIDSMKKGFEFLAKLSLAVLDRGFHVIENHAIKMMISNTKGTPKPLLIFSKICSKGLLEAKRTPIESQQAFAKSHRRIR